MAVVSVHDLRRSQATSSRPILKTILFTIVVPGFVTVGAPYLPPRRISRAWTRSSGLARPALHVDRSQHLFQLCMGVRGAGLGTPAPIAPTKFLVVSSLAPLCPIRCISARGSWLVVMGEVARFHAPLLVAYAAFLGLPVYLFVIVIFYEEPTLHRQFGTSYDL